MHKSLQKTSKLVLVIFIVQSWHYNICICKVIENIWKSELDVPVPLFLFLLCTSKCATPPKKTQLRMRYILYIPTRKVKNEIYFVYTHKKS